MSDTQAPPPITPQHYQVLCGLCLGVAFLVQYQQGVWVAGLLTLLIGVLGIVLKIRLSPLLVLLPVAGGQIFPRFDLTIRAVDLDWLAERYPLLQVPDVVLCGAVLGYLAGHYRLHALWYSILPRDPRRRFQRETPLVVPAEQVGKVAPQRRSADSLTPAEFTRFVLQLPLFALLAQGALYLLTPRWSLVELSPRWMQLLVLVWALVVGLFIAGQFFRYWRRRNMSRATAVLLLQDVLWHETRGEQRRVSRWLAWWKLRRRERETP